jgi:hypothetical protein
MAYAVFVNGQRILTENHNHNAVLWDANTGTELAEIPKADWSTRVRASGCFSSKSER